MKSHKDHRICHHLRKIVITDVSLEKSKGIQQSSLRHMNSCVDPLLMDHAEYPREVIEDRSKHREPCYKCNPSEPLGIGKFMFRIPLLVCKEGEGGCSMF